MKRLINIFKARGLWSPLIRELLITLIMEVIIDLPQTATRIDAANYVDNIAENS